MIKKIRLILFTLRFCLMRILEFRNEVLVWMIASTCWAFIALFGVNIIFGQVDTIAGWNKQEVLMLVITYEIFIGLMWVTVMPSLVNLSDVIRTGSFDFYLLKPVGARFLSSTARFEFDNYLRVLILIFVLFSFNVVGINWYLIPGYFLLIFLGVAIFYSLFFIITTSAFWFTRLFNLEDFFDNILNAGRFPVFAYGGALRFVYIYIIPVAFIATFPVQYLLKGGGVELIFLGIAMAVIFYLVSNWFWNFAMRYYSSASS